MIVWKRSCVYRMDIFLYNFHLYGTEQEGGREESNETNRKWQREENDESCKFDNAALSCRSSPRNRFPLISAVFRDRASQKRDYEAARFLSRIILSRAQKAADNNDAVVSRHTADVRIINVEATGGRALRGRAHVNLGNLPRSKCNVTNVKAVPAAVVTCCCKCCNKSREPWRATSAVRIPPLRCART